MGRGDVTSSMKRLGTYLAVAAALLNFVASAQAGVIASGTFPGVGDIYQSATNGSGTLTAGGQTAYVDDRGLC